METTPKFEPTIPGVRRWKFIKKTVAHTLNRRRTITSENEEIVPLEGPYISVSNHRSDLLDVPVMGWVIKDRRTPFFPAKDELNKGWMKTLGLGWLLKGAGAMYFDRDDGKDRARILTEMRAKLQKDENKERQEGLHVFIEETGKNRGIELGWITSSPVMLAIENQLGGLILAGIGGTETPKTKAIHVEFAELSLDGLRSVIDIMKKLKQDPESKSLTALQASQTLEQIEGRPSLSLEQLEVILNPEKKARGVETRKRATVKEPGTTQISRMDLYDIYTEQVLRPALQEQVDIAYGRVGHKHAKKSYSAI